MGSDSSKQEDHTPAVFNLAVSKGLLPDISIDESLLKYSGLDSADVLKSYTSQLQSDMAGKGASYVADLGSSIASLNGVPNGVGLGALIISLILDLEIMAVSSSSESSTLNMLRRVFAEEKASSVRDTMDECMKRLSMHVREPNRVLEEIQRIEKQLSEQLTRLRNSMLHDDQMNSRSLKIWVNGAAFHSQMLIHAERIKKQISSTDSENQVFSIRTVIEHYQSGLQELMKKYKTYKKSTITFYKLNYFVEYGYAPDNCELNDSELDRTATVSVSSLGMSNWEVHNYSMDTYINYMFNTWDQVKKLEEYFLDLKNNIKDLILQHQEFTMKNS